MGFLQTLAQQFGAIWERLSPGHRVILVLLCLVCGGAMVGAVFWASEPDYEILYTGLAAPECASLVAALKDAGVPVRVTDGGGAIMVPAAKMDVARMAAAEKGLPSGSHGGFDAFQNPKIGMTPFAERVTYLNALQNELATTITSLDSVVHARVHLVVPQRSVFKRDAKRPTASVLVATRGNATLTRAQGLAIASLVASAVEGMAPEDVTVPDGRGNVVAGGGEGGPEMAADDQLAYRRSVETYLAENAETMLATVLGASRCRVRVTAELDFQDSRETRREYDPTKKVLVSERIETSESEGAGMEVGGAVGSAGNVPGQGQPAATSSAVPGGQSKSETIDTQYMVTELVTEKVTRGASIKRLTVAAFVDLEAPDDQADSGEGGAGGQTVVMPKIADIEPIIKEAVGFDESRGDSLKIVQARFQPAAVQLPAMAGSRVPTWAVTAGQYFAIAALGLVLLFVARRVLKSMPADGPRRVIIPEVLGPDGTSTQPVQLSQDELIRREIEKLVQGNPQSASRLLEGWVEGEE